MIFMFPHLCRSLQTPQSQYACFPALPAAFRFCDGLASHTTRHDAGFRDGPVADRRQQRRRRVLLLRLAGVAVRADGFAGVTRRRPSGLSSHPHRAAPFRVARLVSGRSTAVHELRRAARARLSGRCRVPTGEPLPRSGRAGVAGAILRAQS